MLLLALLAVLGLIYTQAASVPAAPTPASVPGVPLAVNPMPAALGAAPQSCMRGPAPVPLSPAVRPVIGSAPVWVAGFDGPQATLHISNPAPAAYTRYGWSGRLLWEVGPNYPNSIILQGKNLRDGAPLWFQLADQAATTTLILNPGAPHAVSWLGSGWAEWSSAVYIAVAGCYSLEAIWPGGQWQLIFAAGKGQVSIPPAGRRCVNREIHCQLIEF